MQQKNYDINRGKDCMKKFCEPLKENTMEKNGVTAIMLYSVPKKIPIVYYNVSNYGYLFIIKESPEEFKKQFTCLGETLKNT